MPKTARKKQLSGVVVSIKMMKTVIVSVTRRIRHPKYQKTYSRSRRFKAHNPVLTLQLGDQVLIEACRPISKDKKWRIIKKI